MEKVLTQATLCFPVRDSKVLLARKTRHIGEGCWNGYGGGFEGEETPEECVLRELSQESGLVGDEESLILIAVADFHNTKSDGEVFTCRVYTYTLSKWEGDAQATEEMADPSWFPIARLPIGEMMLADAEWLPRALTDGPIYVEAWYGPKQKELLRPVEIRSLPLGEI